MIASRWFSSNLKLIPSFLVVCNMSDYVVLLSCFQPYYCNSFASSHVSEGMEFRGVDMHNVWILEKKTDKCESGVWIVFQFHTLLPEHRPVSIRVVMYVLACVFFASALDILSRRKKDGYGFRLRPETWILFFPFCFGMKSVMFRMVAGWVGSPSHQPLHLAKYYR